MIAVTKQLVKDKVATDILDLIKSSKMQAGDRILSEKKLASLLKVNHLTLRAGLKELELSGIIEKKARSGTFFTGKLPDANKKNAVLVMRSDKDFYGDIKDNVIEGLQRNGYLTTIGSIDLFNVNNILSDMKQIFSWESNVLIIEQADIEKSDEIRDFFNENTKHFSKIIRLLGVPDTTNNFVGKQITIDLSKGYRESIKKFKEKGHTKIAFLGGCIDNDYIFNYANKRYISLYTDAMIEEGLVEHIIIRGESDEEKIKNNIYELLSMKERPTAFLCMTDYRGALVASVATKMGLKIPEDIAIIGFYNTYWARHYQISTFTIKSNLVAETLLETLSENNYEKKEKTILMEPIYIDRGSV